MIEIIARKESRMRERKYLKYGAVIVVLIMSLLAACKPKAAEPAPIDSGIRYVSVKDGLNMRENPSTTGKKMLTIPPRRNRAKA
jgi:hypothetical protein